MGVVAGILFVLSKGSLNSELSEAYNSSIISDNLPDMCVKTSLKREKETDCMRTRRKYGIIWCGGNDEI